MADITDREHYIPLRKSDLVAFLLKDAKLNSNERQPFQQFCKLVSAVWHFEYLETLEKLKDGYAPFDPDSVTKPLTPLPPDSRPAKMDRLFDDVVAIMEKANFKRMSRKDIDEAVEGGASDWGVNMSVEWDVFERMEIFSRGEGKVTRVKKHPLFFWRKDEKSVETYRRLVLLLKLRKHKSLPEGIDTNGVFLKVFKDIPKLDLEMVLPGTTMQMPGFQKLKMGGSLLGTFGYGIYKTAATIWAGILAAAEFTYTAFTSAVGVIMGPVILLGGYAYKQYAGYQVTKQTYSKMLTESLYFQNLDNNNGVITQLVDEAEEQECRETLLAYFYLWKYAPAEGWTMDQLDKYIEMELEGKLELKVDFEVDDAIAKLEKLGIVTKSGENYRAVGLEQALERMDYRWDHYFEYNQA